MEGAEDAERKAKAARAKKLLAQRQKAKANSVNTASSPNTPSRPVSIIGDATTASSTRTSLSVEDGARENNDEKPTGLPSPVTPSTKEVIQSESPSHPDGTKGSSSSRPSSASQNASSDPVVNLQRTVSLLIAERSDLQTQIASLQALLTSAKGDSQLLAEGRTLISQLEREKRDLEAGLNESNERANKAAETAIELRKAETQLESLRKEREDLVGQIGDVEKRRLEREEGERVRTRELERAREREGGLEAEVGRLRQSNSELSSSVAKIESEIDSLRSSSTESASSLYELQAAHSTLQSTYDAIRTSHSLLESEHSSLQSSHDSLKATSEESTSSHATLSSSLDTTRSELTSTKSSLERTTKRAEAAEKKRLALQGENDELVRQLEEVRGRVVEVMEEKVELAASVESWKGKGKTWEKTRVELEARAEEAAALHDQLSSIAEDNRVLSEKGDAHDLLQKEHAALQSQLEQLRSSASSIPLPTSPPPSDTDADGSLSLALSQSTERIRTLEASLHAATSRVHQLSRQLTDLQAAYATIQREKERDDLLLASSSPPSMGGIRTRGLGFSPTNEPTSPGLGLGRPPIISSRSVDMILPASVRQKRQVSLSALKARMDASKPLPSPSKMEAVVEGEGRSSPRRSDSSTHLAAQSQARKQFGDEIVFCCPACEGDLITL